MSFRPDSNFWKANFIWIGFSIAISIGLNILLGWILGMIASIIIFMLIMYWFTQKPLSRGKYFGMPKSGEGEGFKSQAVAHCGKCGYKLGQKDRICPKCGSNWSRWY